MPITLEPLRRPPPVDVDRSQSTHRQVGMIVGVVGLMLATVTLVANFVAADRLPTSAEEATEILAWSFGLTTTFFGVVKVGIAIVLVGIIMRLWRRVDGVKAALQRLAPRPQTAAPAPARGEINTQFGRATATTTPPRPLLIHRIAKVAWLPMLAMGAMAVLAGLIISFAWSGNVASNPGLAQDLSAWTQGLQFLGEGFLLSGISFLLGTILAGLREGGGEVQHATGVTVQTLKMPLTAKVFIGLMAVGMMAAMAQFVLYLVATTTATGVSFAAWSAWLGPLREIALGLLLAGIVLALATIGTVLAFQFNRITTILRTGL